MTSTHSHTIAGVVIFCLCLIILLALTIQQPITLLAIFLGGAMAFLIRQYDRYIPWLGGILTLFILTSSFLPRELGQFVLGISISYFAGTLILFKPIIIPPHQS